jgi:hypothetical protein
MRAAQDLLCAPTIGRGSAQPGGGWGSQRSQISTFQAAQNVWKPHQNSRFPALTCIDLKTAKNAIFYLKALNKIYFWDVFDEYINFKIFLCGVVPVQSFGGHICPNPPGIGLNKQLPNETFLSQNGKIRSQTAIYIGILFQGNFLTGVHVFQGDRYFIVYTSQDFWWALSLLRYVSDHASTWLDMEGIRVRSLGCAIPASLLQLKYKPDVYLKLTC